MRKSVFIILLLCAFSSLFATIDNTYKQDCKVTFIKNTENEIGYSSTSVSFNSLTPNKITEAKFNIDSNSEYRETSFYIYWKVFVPEKVSVTMTILKPLTSETKANTQIDFYSAETFKEGILATSSGTHVDFKDSVQTVSIYSETETATAPRVGSKLIALRISNDEIQNEEIDSTTPVFATTIQVTLTTT